MQPALKRLGALLALAAMLLSVLTLPASAEDLSDGEESSEAAPGVADPPAGQLGGEPATPDTVAAPATTEAAVASNGDTPPAAASATDDVLAPAAAPVNVVAPLVLGVPTQDATLNAVDGTWTGGVDTRTRQWLRCNGNGIGSCSDIPGATGASYTLGSADVGRRIRVTETVSNRDGTRSATSLPLGPILAAVAPSILTPPTVLGDAAVGGTLTATDGLWAGTPASLGYTWERCSASSCATVPGADTNTYTVTAADSGSALRVVVTATNAAGTASAPSTRTPTVPYDAPVVQVPPAVSGDTRAGATLSASTGTWSGTPATFSFQWQRCDGSGCTAIAAAGDADTYTLTADEVGAEIRVHVTATNAGGSAEAASAAVGPVLAVAPVNTDPPAIAGVPAVGRTLTADPGSWDGTATITYSHQWLRCDLSGNDCTPIPGADSVTYTLQADDTHHTIRVQVTGTNVGGDASAQSDPTGRVIAAASLSTDSTDLEPDGTVTVSGTGFEPGSTVTITLEDAAVGAPPLALLAVQSLRPAASVVLGSATADAAGEFSATVSLAGVAPGSYVLHAWGTSVDATPLVLSTPVTVQAPPVPPIPTAPDSTPAPQRPGRTPAPTPVPPAATPRPPAAGQVPASSRPGERANGRTGLARTGTDTVLLAPLGAALLAGGLVATGTSRRRRT